MVQATGWSPLGGRIMRLPDVDGQGIVLRRPETEGKQIVINGTVWVLPLKTDNGWRKIHAIRGKPEGNSGVFVVNSHTRGRAASRYNRTSRDWSHCRWGWHVERIRHSGRKPQLAHSFDSKIER